MSSITDLFNLSDPRDAQIHAPGSFVLATITANNDDKHKGLVKVAFTGWDKKKNVYEWIPVLSSYAGNEHGVYIQPEIGDVVIVGFVGPGMKTPFILGSLYSSKSKMLGESAEKKNMNRRLKTKGGIVVELTDEKGKEAVHVATPKELTVLVEDEKETISIQDKAGENGMVVDCKKGELALSAKKKITLTVGQSSITIESKGITIKAGKCDIAATQTATIDGKQSVKVTAGMLALEGKTAKMKADGPAEIAGAVVKIN